jgi:prolyl-tRNA synthetase
VAPFKAAVINLKQGDAACDALCDRLYAALPDRSTTTAGSARG